jgi:hypothetical protein
VDDLYGGLAAERAVPLARRLAELRRAGAH